MHRDRRSVLKWHSDTFRGEEQAGEKKGQFREKSDLGGGHARQRCGLMMINAITMMLVPGKNQQL